MHRTALSRSTMAKAPRKARTAPRPAARKSEDALSGTRAFLKLMGPWFSSEQIANEE